MKLPIVIGDQSTFAVLISPSKDCEGVRLLGRICYCIAGQLIGDFDLVTSLRDCIIAMRWIASDCGKRYSESLSQLNATEFFERVDGALYGFEDTPFDEIANSDGWAKFDIKINIDVFDGWKIYAVDGLERSRIAWRNQRASATNQVCDVQLPLGTVDDAIRKAYDFLNDWYESERLSADLSSQ